jgi:hypothetical protein
MNLERCLWLLIPLISTLCAAADSVSYEKQIAPVLASRCSTCHGAPWSADQVKSPPGGVDTTSYVALKKGGANGPVLVPGSPQRSRILRQPSPSEVATCEAYKARVAKSPRRASVMGEPASQQEKAACHDVQHPSLNASEAEVVSAWIKDGAPFDAEPTPRNCIFFTRVSTSKNKIPDVYYRTINPGLATLSAIDPESGKTLVTVSECVTSRNYPQAGTESQFLLNDVLPPAVDLHFCLPFSSDPFGLLVGLGFPERGNLSMTSIDPPIAAPGEWDKITLTTWRWDAGIASLKIVSAGSRDTVFAKSGIGLSRGLNRIVWNELTTQGVHSGPGDYVAYLTIVSSPEESVTLAFLFRLGAT